MAWTAPMTAVANTPFTAAQFNTHVRDNLLETAPGKATSSIANGSILTKSNTNQVTWRTPSISSVLTEQSSSSTSYTNLTTNGPSVTVSTGSKALVMWSCSITNNSSNSSFMTVAVTGASTVTASDDKAIRFRETTSGTTVSMGTSYMWTTLNSGTNTFTAKYRVIGGTGTWANRHLIVIPL